jgi:hypothetical protein
LLPAEAADVAGNDYFGTGGEAFKILGAKDHTRLMTSLAFLKHKKIAKGLNPKRDRKMGYFLSAIAVESENAIKVNYKGLSKKEKGRLVFKGKPYVMAFVDNHVSDIAVGASIDAMISGGGEKQYNAVKAFLLACEAAKKANATGLTPEIRATFKKLRDHSRWGLFLNEKVRARYIESLPKALSNPIIKALRR